MDVPHPWLLSETLAASLFVRSCAIGCTDSFTCDDPGAEIGACAAMPTCTPIASAAVAAAPAVQVTRPDLRRRQFTLPSSDGSSTWGSIGPAPSRPAIVTKSSRSSCDSRAGMPLSSPMALRHDAQSAICCSNSRHSARDSDPSTYAASHISYSSCPDKLPPCDIPDCLSGITMLPLKLAKRQTPSIQR